MLKGVIMNTLYYENLFAKVYVNYNSYYCNTCLNMLNISFFLVG